MSVRFTAGSGTGLETSAATDTPAFPVSISVWFHIEPESESDDYLIWWFGDESSPTNHLLLKYDVNSSKVVLSPGSGYNSGIGDLESSATVSGNEWHLATVVIEYNAAADTLEPHAVRGRAGDRVRVGQHRLDDASSCCLGSDLRADPFADDHSLHVVAHRQSARSANHPSQPTHQDHASSHQWRRKGSGRTGRSKTA